MSLLTWAALILAAIAVFVGLVIVASWLKKHGSSITLVTLQDVARTVVNAAEQMGKVASWTGDQKLQWAENEAVLLGKKIGVNLATVDWRALIEDAVKLMNDVAAAATIVK